MNEGSTAFAPLGQVVESCWYDLLAKAEVARMRLEQALSEAEARVADLESDLYYEEDADARRAIRRELDAARMRVARIHAALESLRESTDRYRSERETLARIHREVGDFRLAIISASDDLHELRRISAAIPI